MRKALFFLGMLMFSCAKDPYSEEFWIYKTKADYTNKVYVELSQDKSKITYAPGPSDVNPNSIWPMRLESGYLLNGIPGRNTGFLSVEISDYHKWSHYIGADSLYSLILDKDPFIELYYYHDDDREFIKSNGLDTVKMNEIIRSGQLEKYFDRLK